MLSPNLDIAGNIFLGNEKRGVLGRLNRSEMCRIAESLLKRGVKPVVLPSHQFVGNTSAAEQLEAFYEAYRKSLKHLFE